MVIGLEYQGQGFYGWQAQPRLATLQGCVEAALSEIAAHPVRAHAAGRTDRGVHAGLQIVHFDTDANRPPNAWVRGVNHLLPETVAVLWAQPVSPDFHARFSAYARHYRYILLNHPIRSALMAGRVGWCHRPLDIEAMRGAAKSLLGEHDFSCFRSRQCQAKSPFKTIYRLTLERYAELIVIDISANAFLHHMVRNIVGALIFIGQGRQPASWLTYLLETKDRRCAAPTFMADGLYFLGADYPAPFKLHYATYRRHYLC